jgi:hypothetical protein
MALKKSKGLERGVTPKGKRKKAYDEIYLWPIYSLFIRFRDTDKNGIGQCFTCKTPKHWKQLECGHGIGRQHKGTKYNEKNNHGQCHKCNGFEEGRKDLYKVEMDKLYGAGTWQWMEIASKVTTKIGHFEYDILVKEYLKRVVELAEEKQINPLELAPVKFILKNHKGADHSGIKAKLNITD